MILAGDVPLITAEAIDALVEAHEDSGAAGTMATMEPDDPGQYGRVVRDDDGQRRAGRRGQGGEGDATPEQLAIREVNTGIYAFDGAALLDALDRSSTPTTRRASSTCPTCCRSSARRARRSART